MFEAITEALVGLIVGLTLCLGFALRPTHARCPGNLALDAGVRISGPDAGAYSCATIPPPDDDHDNGNDPPYTPPERVRGKIYCTNGTRPIQIDTRTVGCQRYREQYW